MKHFLIIILLLVLGTKVIQADNIDLIKFNLVQYNDKVLVTWSTSSETNSKSFEIYASRDSVIWLPVGKILGSGTTENITHYSYVNNTVYKYYKLKHITKKTITYSDVRQINNIQDGTLVSIVIVTFDGKVIMANNEFDFVEHCSPYGNVIIIKKYDNGIITNEISYDETSKSR